MIPDPTEADKMYDAAKKAGLQGIALGLFDRRFLLTFEQVAESSQALERPEDHLQVAQLADLSGRGWFPLIPGAQGDPHVQGVPLYVESRVQLLLELERAGYTETELKAAALHEERIIDMLVDDDIMPYEDDNLNVVVRATKSRIEAFDPEKQKDKYDREQSQLARIEKLERTKPRSEVNAALDRYAFHIRMIEECLRLHDIEEYREKLRRRYSWSVQFNGYEWRAETGFHFGNIDWKATLEVHHSESPDAPIRVPGFVLESGRLTTTRPTPPCEYDALWNSSQMDRYFAAWEVFSRERRTCAHCDELLPKDSDRKRVYCSDKCRGTARQKRYRERNPAAVYEAQRKYWSSIDDE